MNSGVVGLEVHTLDPLDGGSLVPAWCELPVDLVGFEEAFATLAGDGPGVLLESLDLEGRPGPFTIVAGDPAAVVVADTAGVRLTHVRRQLPALEGWPLPGASVGDSLAELARRLAAPEVPGLPTCSGGLAGMFAYEASELLHGHQHPGRGRRRIGDPVCLLILDRVAVFDHRQQRLCLVAHVPADADRSVGELALGAMEQALRTAPRGGPLQPDGGNALLAAPNVSPQMYREAVRRSVEQIRAGEIFQVVLSRRLTVPAREDGFSIYRRLRQTNPSPAMFFVRLPGLELAGSSPEPLLKVHGRRALTRPIAGTRPRGDSPEDDRRLAAELRADPKECAEHAMLVDLARNDLGRVCAPGSVQVTQLMEPQDFPRVIHLVSTVEGELAAGRSPLDALFSTFPAGTVTGAPKRRAMEIIAAEEPTPRGPYAGAVGYCSFAGELDFCITIRTAVVASSQVHVQAGAGVVADSDPDRELLETEAKASAILAAVGRPGGSAA